jgi:toxin ParE1/3/4
MGHRLAPRANADLEELAFYVFVETGSLEIANRLVDSITERFVLLGAHPSAGRRRDDLRPDIRSFPVGSYLVLYRVEGNDVVVLRVVRGSRDLDALFRGAYHQKDEPPSKA